MQIQNCEFPEDLYFDIENDVWLKPVNEKLVIVGATTILPTLAGKIKGLHFKKGLNIIKRGQMIATIESGKYFGAVRCPIDGTIVALNTDLETSPNILNDSPYSSGWVAKLSPDQGSLSNWAISKILLQAGEAATKLESRIIELKVHCFKKIPDEQLISVGVECTTTLVNLGELLKSRPMGTVVHILSDDPLASIELVRWTEVTGNELIEMRDEGNLHHFLIEKKNDQPVQ